MRSRTQPASAPCSSPPTPSSPTCPKTKRRRRPAAVMVDMRICIDRVCSLNALRLGTGRESGALSVLLAAATASLRRRFFRVCLFGKDLGERNFETRQFGSTLERLRAGHDPNRGYRIVNVHLLDRGIDNPHALHPSVEVIFDLLDDLVCSIS